MSFEPEYENNDPDPVDVMTRTLTAKSVVDWMVQYHGLNPDKLGTVERNLREQFARHRLQGRLDRHPVAAVIAQLWGLRHKAKDILSRSEE